MGPGTLSKKDVQGSRKQLDRHLAQVPEIEPVSTAIFGGVVDPTQLSFPFSHMPASRTRVTGARSERGRKRSLTRLASLRCRAA